MFSSTPKTLRSQSALTRLCLLLLRFPEARAFGRRMALLGWETAQPTATNNHRRGPGRIRTDLHGPIRVLFLRVTWRTETVLWMLAGNGLTELSARTT
jgi:hypothetical protein